MRNTRYKYWWPCLIGLLLVFPSQSFAQVATGDIYGKVTDQQGSVLPGVTVTLSSELIPDKVVTTTERGVYRFPELPAGLYSVRYSNTGFQTLHREGIPVSVGSTVVLNVALTIGGVEEVVTVAGESPVLDTRHTGIGASLDEEILANIPSSRDPWTVLAFVPHVTVDRINVGGTESGQQSNFMGAGSMNSQAQGGSAQWSIDGVVITDMTATGSSPTYYDFDSFQEIEVSSGGHEAQIPFGSIGINFVTKQGGNAYSGQASFYGTGEALQSENTPDTEEFDDVSTNKINKIRDWGFDVGGPIVEDRAWFWGSFRNQDISVTVLSRNFEPPVDGAASQRDLCFFNNLDFVSTNLD